MPCGCLRLRLQRYMEACGIEGENKRIMLVQNALQAEKLGSLSLLNSLLDPYWHHMKSTIVIFVIIFAVLGLLLGFAESTNVDNSSGGLGSFAKYRINTDPLEIDPTDSENGSSE
jgi:hypothetical protein